MDNSIINFDQLQSDIDYYSGYNAPVDWEVIHNVNVVAKDMLEQYAPDLYHRLTADHLAVTATDLNMLLTLTYVFGVIGFGLLFVLVNGGYTFIYSYYWCKTSYNASKCVKEVIPTTP